MKDIDQQIEEELLRAKLMAMTLDAVNQALAPREPDPLREPVTLWEVDVICPRCGAYSLRFSRQAPTAPEIHQLCTKCTTGE